MSMSQGQEQEQDQASLPPRRVSFSNPLPLASMAPIAASSRPVLGYISGTPPQSPKGQRFVRSPYVRPIDSTSDSESEMEVLDILGLSEDVLSTPPVHMPLLEHSSNACSSRSSPSGSPQSTTRGSLPTSSPSDNGLQDRRHTRVESFGDPFFGPLKLVGDRPAYSWTPLSPREGSFIEDRGDGKREMTAQGLALSSEEGLIKSGEVALPLLDFSRVPTTPSARRQRFVPTPLRHESARTYNLPHLDFRAVTLPSTPAAPFSVTFTMNDIHSPDPDLVSPVVKETANEDVSFEDQDSLVAFDTESSEPGIRKTSDRMDTARHTEVESMSHGDKLSSILKECNDQNSMKHSPFELFSLPAQTLYSSPSPLLVPSAPATPNFDDNEYDAINNGKNQWLHRGHHRSSSREIESNSDSVAERNQNIPVSPTLRPRPKGLRGRIPAAIARLNLFSEYSDESGVEDKLTVEDDEDGHHDEEDEVGSLADFIVDSDSEETYDDSDEESDWKERSPRQDVVYEIDDSEDDAIISYSPPPRPKGLPDISGLTLADSPPVKPPKKTVKSAQPTLAASASTSKSRRAWEVQRAQIAQDLFDELDEKVFQSRLGEHGAKTIIEWNNRLLTTAGTASKVRNRQPDKSVKIDYKIALSVKVLNEEDQILNTVAHEMCHLASWIISDEHKNPHGKVFKSWGRKVMRIRKDIEVTTKHRYEIEYKYEWQCSNSSCGGRYRRHSKSINPDKQVCGRCRSRLEPLFATKTSTAFQAYLKENMAYAKKAHKGATHGDVMRALSKRWADAGSEGDHMSYWKEMALRQSI